MNLGPYSQFSDAAVSLYLFFVIAEGPLAGQRYLLYSFSIAYYFKTRFALIFRYISHGDWIGQTF